MKQEDFERLKAVCEKEGFDLELSSPSHQTYRISKKDVWDGVEFAQCINDNLFGFTKGKIYKLIDGYSIDDYNSFINDIGDKGSAIGHHLSNRGCFKPSTEQAYIEQLKKEAHERFGEIKDGDTFMDEPNGFIRSCNKGMDNWYYSREKDALFAFGARIYKQGKWATRVKERVKVELIHETLSNNPTYQFKLTNWNETNRAKESGQFLAS